ncbi:MAG: GNAT family N-acetyltransferase [Actinomycetota bacterium]|nr:GNAT family N-acetyltransferase [Actinomycetota bacterium]
MNDMEATNPIINFARVALISMNGESSEERQLADKVTSNNDEQLPPLAFLKEYLGGWPEEKTSITIISDPKRDEPGWDGAVRRAVGVIDENGAGVLSLAPHLADPLLERLGKDKIFKDEVGEVARHLGAREFFGVFRWSTSINSFDDIGQWIDANDESVPDWLKPFGHEVLVAFDDDHNYIGGVGIKYHLEHGREIAVVVDERAARRQVARRLVSKAALAILDGGNVPIYLHAESNVASARVAEAVGFKDRGWRIIGMNFE